MLTVRPAPQDLSLPPGRITCRVRPPFDLDVELVGDAQTTAMSLRLPCEVLAEQTGRFEWQQDHFAMRLQCEPSTTAPSTLPCPAVEYLSAAQLATDRPSGLACSLCANTLIASHPQPKYMAMPSEHWEELIDSWMCHGDQLLNVSVTKGREGIEENKEMKPDEVRVSENAVMWNAAQVIQGGLHDLSEEGSVALPASGLPKSLPARCAGCSTTVGTWIRTGTGSQGHSIKLDKIALSIGDGDLNPLCNPLLLVVAQTMSRVADAQATRHFVLRAEGDDGRDGTGEPLALLWLFQPRTRMSLDVADDGELSKVFDSMSLSGRTAKQTPLIFDACKVLFQARDDSTVPAPETPATAWSVASEQAESLAFPAVFCERLMTFLQASNVTLPASRRRFGPSWRAGWLPAGEEADHVRSTRV
ncbi:unnamed protein product [Parajaminaea phylloscopi]